MKTFSRLSVLMLLFLGVALMLVGGTPDVYAQEASLRVTGDTGKDKVYNVGNRVETFFTASDEDKDPVENADLTITHDGLIGVTISNGGTTDEFGTVVVRGEIISSVAYIDANWDDANLTAKATFAGSPKPPRIVVDPPNVNGTGLSAPLQVGDTFTQEIWARDFIVGTADFVDLSAWQMDITYNPEVLQFVGATEGDFLESGGVDALFMAFMASGSEGKISAHQARIGRETDNAAVPPVETLTAPMAGVTGSGLLMTVEFKLLEFAEEALGLSNIQLSNSQLTPVELDPPIHPSAESHINLELGIGRESYHVVVNPIVATHRFPSVDVNRDGMVDVMDLVAIAAHLSTVPNNPTDKVDMTTANHTRADVNNDGFVNTLDIMAVASSASWGEAVTTINVRGANHNDAKGNAPQAHVAANVTPETIQGWIGILRVEDDGSAIFDLGIANLEALLASRIPTETRLLLNYPNPFNPETWIPYQLAEATDVRVMIHSVNGSLIRMLELGHQAAGTYKNKSQAAYWDGRNELGEQVASGLYFYTLTAGDFSATGKMLIRK